MASTTTSTVNSVEVNGSESWGVHEYGDRGLIMAYTQPSASQSEDEYNDCYNYQHGPSFMKLPFLHDGRRYKARDGKNPTYAAIYTVDDINKVQGQEMKDANDNRSERELKVHEALEAFDMQVYRQMSTRGDPGPIPVKGCLVYRMWVPEKHAEEIHAWYEKEHTGHVAAVPGWVRTRRYRNIEPRKDDLVELLALHEFEDSRGTGGKEHMAAKEKPWRKRVVHELVSDDTSRQLRLVIAFADPKAGTEAYLPPPPSKEDGGDTSAGQVGKQAE
ncbi:MAG: hypothetical protein M1828_002605 [Chrysothrix sp. TS-e1954]|nr:MAG: hypothetical protein M1828_002605 [Chrysothrix sp. TS-e1954]